MRDKFIYSVDMVRLYTEIRPTEFQIIMNKLQYNSYVEYREMKSIKAYRHNFYIRGSLPTEKDFINMDFDSLENMYQVDKEESYRNYAYMLLYLSFLCILHRNYIVIYS